MAFDKASAARWRDATILRSTFHGIDNVLTRLRERGTQEEQKRATRVVSYLRKFNDGRFVPFYDAIQGLMNQSGSHVQAATSDDVLKLHAAYLQVARRPNGAHTERTVPNAQLWEAICVMVGQLGVEGPGSAANRGFQAMWSTTDGAKFSLALLEALAKSMEYVTAVMSERKETSDALKKNIPALAAALEYFAETGRMPHMSAAAARAERTAAEQKLIERVDALESFKAHATSFIASVPGLVSAVQNACASEYNKLAEQITASATEILQTVDPGKAGLFSSASVANSDAFKSRVHSLTYFTFGGKTGEEEALSRADQMARSLCQRVRSYRTAIADMVASTTQTTLSRRVLERNIGAVPDTAAMQGDVDVMERAASTWQLLSRCTEALIDVPAVEVQPSPRGLDLLLTELDFKASKLAIAFNDIADANPTDPASFASSDAVFGRRLGRFLSSIVDLDGKDDATAGVMALAKYELAWNPETGFVATDRGRSYEQVSSLVATAMSNANVRVPTPAHTDLKLAFYRFAACARCLQLAYFATGWVSARLARLKSDIARSEAAASSIQAAGDDTGTTARLEIDLDQDVKELVAAVRVAVAWEQRSLAAKGLFGSHEGGGPDGEDIEKVWTQTKCVTLMPDALFSGKLPDSSASLSFSVPVIATDLAVADNIDVRLSNLERRCVRVQSAVARRLSIMDEADTDSLKGNYPQDQAYDNELSNEWGEFFHSQAGGDPADANSSSAGVDAFMRMYTTSVYRHPRSDHGLRYFIKGTIPSVFIGAQVHPDVRKILSLFQAAALQFERTTSGWLATYMDMVAGAEDTGKRAPVSRLLQATLSETTTGVTQISTDAFLAIDSVRAEADLAVRNKAELLAGLAIGMVQRYMDETANGRTVSGLASVTESAAAFVQALFAFGGGKDMQALLQQTSALVDWTRARRELATAQARATDICSNAVAAQKRQAEEAKQTALQYKAKVDELDRSLQEYVVRARKNTGLVQDSADQNLRLADLKRQLLASHQEARKKVAASTTSGDRELPVSAPEPPNGVVTAVANLMMGRGFVVPVDYTSPFDESGRRANAEENALRRQRNDSIYWYEKLLSFVSEVVALAHSDEKEVVIDPIPVQDLVDYFTESQGGDQGDDRFSSYVIAKIKKMNPGRDVQGIESRLQSTKDNLADVERRISDGVHAFGRLQRERVAVEQEIDVADESKQRSDDIGRSANAAGAAADRVPNLEVAGVDDVNIQALTQEKERLQAEVVQQTAIVNEAYSLAQKEARLQLLITRLSVVTPATMENVLHSFFKGAVVPSIRQMLSYLRDGVYRLLPPDGDLMLPEILCSNRTARGPAVNLTAAIMRRNKAAHPSRHASQAVHADIVQTYQAACRLFENSVSYAPKTAAQTRNWTTEQWNASAADSFSRKRMF